MHPASAVQNTALARKALDVAVAQSYKIRLTPQYHMSMARLLLRERDAAQALKFLQQAEVRRGRPTPVYLCCAGPAAMPEPASGPCLCRRCRGCVAGPSRAFPAASTGHR